jgi:hypothetical protein
MAASAPSRPLNGPDLFAGGNVHPDLQPTALATLGLLLDAPAAALSKIAHHVAADKPALMCIAEQRGKRDANFVNHPRRSRLRLGARRHVAAAEHVFERAHHRRRELRQLYLADVWLDVKAQMLAINFEGRAL